MLDQILGGSSSGMSGANALALFQSITKTGLAAREAQFKKRADIQNEIAFFRQNAAKVQNTDGFFATKRLHAFALKAYGMPEEITYAGRSKQVMMSDTTSSTSLARRMSDPRHAAIAAAFDFAHKGVDKLKDPAFVEKVIANFVSSQYEANIGESAPALSDALYFRRKIGTLTSTYQLIGDGVLLGVVMDGAGIPRTAAGQSMEKLKANIEQKFDLKKAKDPAYVDKFIARFLVMRDIQAMLSSGSPLAGMLG